MSRFTRFAVVLFSALALVNSTGAAPLKAKRMPAVTQTAADFKELEYVPITSPFQFFRPQFFNFKITIVIRSSKFPMV